MAEKFPPPTPKGHFEERAGFPLVYQPARARSGHGSKHPCPDCHFCQHCPESRCRSCRPGKKKAANKDQR